MVKKIRKKAKPSPKGPQAIPLVMVMTALYGFEREGRDFRWPFQDLDGIRDAIRRHLQAEILPADRILSHSEYLSWDLKSAPGRLTGMFLPSGSIPMGGPMPESVEDPRPRLGILPLLAVARSDELDDFSDRLAEDWPELTAVAFKNSIYPSLKLIPGYDLLIYLPPRPAKDANRGIGRLNIMLEEAFDQAGRPFPGPLDLFPDEVLAHIPLVEPVAASAF